MDPFELSLSPYFNDVIRTAQIVYCDPRQEINKKDLQIALQAMAQFCQVLTASFQEAMKVRPKTDLSQKAPKRFAEAMQELTDSLQSIQRFFKDNDAERIPRALISGKKAIADLFAIFDDMKKEEEAFPVFSKSPFIQELVRLATGVAKNQYRPDVLKEKVRWMKERHKEFKNDFNNLKTSPTENEDVDKLIPVAEKALNAMGNALEEMDSFFRNGDKSKLKHSCEMLLQSGEVLIAVQERLIKASSAQPAACPQCGVINPGGAKTCKECGATLPEIAGIAKQTMEVKEADPNARPRFAYLSRIEDAVENRIRGAISTAELKKHIDFFAAKARNGRKQFEAMKFPDNLTDEEREAAKRAYDLLDQGTATTVKGVEKLEAYIKSESLDDLNVGMDLIHKGADLIIDSQS